MAMTISEFKAYLREEIISVLSEDIGKETQAYLELTKAIQGVANAKKEAGLTEEEMDDEMEPTAADIKKGDSVSKLGYKLAEITKEMKSVVNKWKKAEGEEKTRLLNRLKELTKIKKELEAAIAPGQDEEED